MATFEGGNASSYSAAGGMQITIAGAATPFLRMAITGPSKSGKTLSALLIAKGMVPAGKCCLVDTQYPQGEYYGRQFAAAGWPYGVLNLKVPHTAQNFIQALRHCAQAKIELPILDSVTHLWSQMLSAIDQGGGWKSKAGAEAMSSYEMFVNEVVRYPGHVIVLIRARTEWDKQGNRVGTKPIMRSEYEYEFDVEGALDMGHTMHLTARGGPLGSLHDRRIMCPNETLGVELLQMLSVSGTEKEAPHIPAHIQDLLALRDATGWGEQIKAHVKSALGVPMKDVSPSQAQRICRQVAVLYEHRNILPSFFNGASDGWVSLDPDSVDNLVSAVLERINPGIAAKAPEAEAPKAEEDGEG